MELANAAILLYYYSKFAAMTNQKEKITYATQRLDVRQSVKRAKQNAKIKPLSQIEVLDVVYVWKDSQERIELIRRGLPYAVAEVVSNRVDMPLSYVLEMLDIPQTTYNKKKRNHELMKGKESETVMELTELLDFGLEVFNREEEKFQRWLKKINIALGNVTPISLLDSFTGIKEVRNALSRMEYGNMA